MTQIWRDFDDELTEINHNADEWRQETVKFIENDKTGVLEAITTTKKKPNGYFKNFFYRDRQNKIRY